MPESQRVLKEQERVEKVCSDPISLVRMVPAVKGGCPTWEDLDYLTTFWSRHPTERLALVNGPHATGKEIANLLRYANKELLPQGIVTIEEMLNVLLQYLNWKPISARMADEEKYGIRPHDRSTDVCAQAGVKALWEIIPDLPKELSSFLIEYLPVTEGMSSTFPPTVIESFNEHQLEQLLRRDDISLKEYRHTLYENSSNERVRQAAVSSRHFELRDSDISELVYAPMEQVESGKKKVKDLLFLAFWCKNSTPVQMEAIGDLIKNAPNHFFPWLEVWSKVEVEQILETQRAKNPSLLKPQDKFLSLPMYRIAKCLASRRRVEYSPPPFSIESPEKTLQHKSFIVFANPWQTYLNQKSVIRLDRHVAAIWQWVVELSRPEQILFALGLLCSIFLLYR